MISEVDISDWEMLTEPLELKKVEVLSCFSIPGSNEIFRHYGNLGEAVQCAVLNSGDTVRGFLLPNFLKVHKWISK